MGIFNFTLSSSNFNVEEGVAKDDSRRWLNTEIQVSNKMKKLVVDYSSENVYSYLESHIHPNSKKTFFISTDNPFNILNNFDGHNTIVNLKRINDIRFINKFFESVNETLEKDNLFVCCVETFAERKRRKTVGKIPVIRQLYFFFEFIFMRVFPKLRGFKRIYFFITRGKNRLLSKAEALGRLVSCGFEILDYETIDGKLYIVTKKKEKPSYDMNPSYGPLYKMPRMGKNGKIIGVYKLRTMHPYAEYLHDHILKINGYADSGKPANDFRLTPWGKFMRRYWFDELPQIINLFKGDLKLVGVRPISKRYFQDIPEDLQKLRLTQKPGCIPPYVALNKKGCVDQVLLAEREYLKEKRKNPYTTDTKFFFLALYNIIVKSKRSA
jgi:hypothetical protein